MDAAEVVEKIVKEKNLRREDVERMILEKKEEFGGLLTDLGAAYLVAKELGVDIDIKKVSYKKIGEMKPGDTNVSFVARVMHVFRPKTFERGDRKGRYVRMIVGDETGTARLVLWQKDVDLAEEIERGDVIAVEGAYVEEFRGEKSIHLGFNGRLRKIEEKKDLPEAEKAVKIGDLREDMESVDVNGVVLSVGPIREFGEGRKVGSLIIGDETGTVRVVLWDDAADYAEKFKRGDRVKVEGGYVRDGELHVGWKGRIIRSRAELPPLEEIGGRERKSISEVREGEMVEVRGTVVQVYDVPPAIPVCPHCGSKVEKVGKWICPKCGEIEGPNFRAVASFEIDDGTGTLRVVVFGSQAESLYGKTADELYRSEVPSSELLKTLLGEDLVVYGFIRKNQVLDRLEMNAREVEKANVDEEIARLLDKLGVAV